MNEDADLKPLLTKREVAAYHQVTTRTIQNWTSRGILRPVRRGGTVRFRRADIIEMGWKEDDVVGQGGAEPE
jgi:excisionase family DNA binding protein